MGKWLFAGGALAVAALVGLVLWQLSDSPDAPGRKPAPPSNGPKAKPRTDVPTDAAAKPVARRAIDAAPDVVPLEGLGANPEALQDRVDVIVPAKIRALAADCYDGGLDPDLTIKVNYRLRVLRGKLFTQNVHIEKSELGDHPELERCIVAAVETAEWRDDEMPDFDEDEELFIRLRTLSKYKDRGDEGGEEADE